MGVHVEIRGIESGAIDAPCAIVLRLTGWSRVANMRRAVTIEHDQIVSASATLRSAVENDIDRRVVGIGSHHGSSRPNRARVGTMLGRGVDGIQFWAVRASGPELPVLVLDLRDHEFVRAVVAIDDPYAVARALTSRAAP